MHLLRDRELRRRDQTLAKKSRVPVVRPIAVDAIAIAGEAPIDIDQMLAEGEGENGLVRVVIWTNKQSLRPLTT